MTENTVVDQSYAALLAVAVNRELVLLYWAAGEAVIVHQVLPDGFSVAPRASACSISSR